MKQLLIAAACFLLVNGETAIAQSTGSPPGTKTQAMAGFSPNTQQAIAAQNQFDQYNVKYRNNSLEGRKILESVHAHGLAKTAKNVKTIRSLLSSTVTSDEKVVLARILGSLYTYDDKTGMNNAIAQDLRSLAYSEQKDVARAATLAFSRLGYFQDFNDVLLSAHNRGLISTNEYYGDLAHIVSFAPADAQFNLVSIIKNGKNQYAAEILAFVAREPETMKRLYPETKKLIHSYLEENEPGFAQALGTFDLIDAIRYSTWLQAVAQLVSYDSNHHKI